MSKKAPIQDSFLLFNELRKVMDLPERTTSVNINISVGSVPTATVTYLLSAPEGAVMESVKNKFRLQLIKEGQAK